MTATEKLEKRIEGIENFQEIVAKFVTRLGDPSQYKFDVTEEGGYVIDLGEYGRGKCTCGHPVRYLLLIWGPNGEVAPIGCECVKHFMNYNSELYNKLEGARQGLMEAIAADERERLEAERQAERANLQPVYELARRRFLAVCKMHEENIGRGRQYTLPFVMWKLKSELLKKPEYKTTLGYNKFYVRMTLEIEKVLGQYERGEVR
jgi:hypothetical protein